MSLDIQAAVICDNCGVRRVFAEHRLGRVHRLIRSGINGLVRMDGWIELTRGHYHTMVHYCSVCADRPIKPVKRKKK